MSSGRLVRISADSPCEPQAGATLRRAARRGRTPTPDLFDLMPKFVSDAGGGVPGILAHLVQVPGERYSKSDEI